MKPSDNWYRLFVYSNDAPVLVFLNGILVDFNKHAQCMFNLNPEIEYTNSIEEFLKFAEEGIKSDYSSFLAHSKSQTNTLQCKWVFKKDKEIHINCQLFSLMEKSEEYLILIIQRKENTSSTNIYPKNSIDLPISEQEHFLQTLLENIPLMVYIKEVPNLNYILANQYYANFLGKEIESIIGSREEELNKEIHDEVEKFDQQVLNHRQPISRKITFTNVDRVFNFTQIPVIRDNQVKFIIGIGQEVTLQHQNEKLLKRELLVNKSLAYASTELISPDLSIEKIAKTIFNSAKELTGSSTGFIVFNDTLSDNVLIHTFPEKNSKAHNLSGNIIFMQREKFLNEGLYGYRINSANQEVKNKIHLKVRNRIGKDSPDEIVNYFSIPAISNGNYMGHIVMINNKDGYTPEHMEQLLSLNNAYSLAVYRKRLEWENVAAKEKAEESDRLKSAFLANMSHEVRTPMNAIMGFGQLLISPFVDDEKKKEFYTLVSNSCNDLLRLINDIIDISKIDSGQMVFYPDKFRLGGLLYEIEEETRSRLIIKDKTIKFYMEVLPEVAEFDIYFDKTRLRQVIMNIIDNAIKFTREGTIEFRIDLNEQGFIRFEVKDSGIGIAPLQQKNIFESFRQADLNLSRAYGGTGIGLAIAKSIVEQMGGKIGLFSELNVGSSFFFTIPFTLPERNNQKAVEDLTENKIDLSRKTILVVEDEPRNAHLLNLILEEIHAKVINVYDGKEAVELVKKRMPDLILMDIHMPLMDGIEATKQIKKINCDVPIIAQTAYAYKEDEDRCYQAGCVAYITKPIRKKELLATIMHYLNNE